MMSTNNIFVMAVYVCLSYALNIDLQCPQNDELMHQITNDLSNQGYVVEKGFIQWKVDTPNYGTQPEMGYGIYNFNRSSDFGVHGPNKSKYINKTLSFHIRHHQSPNNFWFMYGTSAVLINWCLPPTYYYSYGTYVNRIFNPNTSNFTRKHYLPETDPYGSLTDMLNNLNIKYNATGNAYYNTSFIISTPDNKTYVDIYNSINKYHNQTQYNDVNVQEMPYQYCNFKNQDWVKQVANGETLDSFDVVLRAVYLPPNNTYWTVNQSVYKIYPKNNETKEPREPYLNYEETYNIDQKDIIFNEQENYQKYFDLYLKAVSNYFLFGDKSFGYIFTLPSTPYYKNAYNYGYSCIDYGTRCLGDNRDAQYFFQYPNAIYLPNNTIQFVIGIHHENVNVCEWGNFVPYFEEKNIVQYITKKYYRSNELYLNYAMMKGSSMLFPGKYWINNTIPDDILNNIWIAVVLRDNMLNKFNFSNIIPSLIVDEHKLPLNNKWFPMERCYLNKITKTRPAPYTMISEYVMEFLHFNHD